MRTWSYGWFVVVGACGVDPALECSALDVEACAADDACMAIVGYSLEVLTTAPNGTATESCYSHGDDLEPVGCQARDTTCVAAEEYASPSDDPSSVWLLPSGCIPAGWVLAAPLRTCL